ncbi:VOC family protein [Streptomyces sp. NPDC001108]
MSNVEDTTPTPGTPCWVNLMARNLEKAQGFYSEIMGWEFRRSTLDDDLTVALTHGERVAGIGCCREAGQPVIWTPYFAVRDADETAGRISERGATLAVGPLPLGNGRAGVAADRDGAVFGFWEGPIAAWRVGHGNAPARLDLETRDAFDAAIFYAEVFGWAQPPSACTVDYAHDRVLVRSAGHTLATVHSRTPDSDPEGAARPRWVVDFRVGNPARTAAAAVAAGGNAAPVTSPLSAASGSTFVIHDPEGAFFTVSGG